MRRFISFPLSVFTLVVVSAAPQASADRAKTLSVTSSAFGANEAIPSEYTCDGTGLAPPLSWSGVPSDAKSIAIVVEDSDAPKGTFAHWVVANIPPNQTSLSDNTSLPDEAVVANNDQGAAGYMGPCPPSGTHHYHFRVYALDKKLAQPKSRTAFMQQIKGHVLAVGELVGTYSKQATSTDATDKPMKR